MSITENIAISKGNKFIQEYTSYVEKIIKSYELENMLIIAQNEYINCYNELESYRSKLIYPCENDNLIMLMNKKNTAENNWNTLITLEYNNACFGILNISNLYNTKLDFMDALNAPDVSEDIKNYIKNYVETEEIRLSNLIVGGPLITS